MDTLYVRSTLQQLFKQKRPDLAPGSVTTYVNIVLRIQRDLGQPTDDELEAYLDKFKPTQARNMLTPLMIIYEGSQRHRRLFEKYNAAANDQLDSQRLSASELKNWVNKRTVRKMIKRLREDCETHKVFRSAASESKWRLRQGFVVWSIHYHFPWRNILGKCRVVNDISQVDDKANYYAVREQTFCIADFKTSKVFVRHGHELPLKHRVPAALAQVIAKHLRHRPESGYLFSDLIGRPLSKNAYSNLLTGTSKRYLAKRIGSSLWRHISLTDWSRVTPTLKQRRDMAFLMHQVSLVTQMRYVRPEA